MAGLKEQRTLRDLPESEEEPLNEYDRYARSIRKPGNVNSANPKHAMFISQVINAIESGLISEAGVKNAAKYNPSIAPMLFTSYNNYKTKAQGKSADQQLIGQYVNPGSPEIGRQGTGGNGDYSEPPTDPSSDYAPAVTAKRDYQGLSDDAFSKGRFDLAKMAKEQGGIDKTGGRGEYYTPVQTASGIRSFNSRTGKLEDSSTMPVVGSASDPNLQGQLAAAKAHGAAVGKDVAGAGNLADSGIAIYNASKILDKGIYSGAWGPTQKEIAKRFPGADKSTASNTEEFLSYVGNVVIPMMKDLGGSDTVEELNYMKSLVAGDISMEKSAIRNILAATNKKIDTRQSRLKSQAKTVGLGNKANASSTNDEKQALTPAQQRLKALLQAK